MTVLGRGGYLLGLATVVLPCLLASLLFPWRAAHARIWDLPFGNPRRRAIVAVGDSLGAT